MIPFDIHNAAWERHQELIQEATRKRPEWAYSEPPFKARRPVTASHPTRLGALLAALLAHASLRRMRGVLRRASA